MKTECILPESFDALQTELNNMHMSVQEFILDERIPAERRQEILESALGKSGAEKFIQVANAKIAKELAAKAEKELKRENIKQDIVEDLVLNRIRRLQGKLSPEYEKMYFERVVQEDMKVAVTQEQAESLVEAQTSIDAALQDMNTAISNAKDAEGKPLFNVKSYKDIYKEEDIEKIHKDPVLYKKYIVLGLAIRNYNKLYGDIQQQVLNTTGGAVFKKILGSTRSAILSADIGFGRNIANMLFVSPKTFGKAWLTGFKRMMQDVWYGTRKDKNGNTLQDYAWAEIYAHPNVISGRLKQLGINIDITEEQFLNSYITEATEKSEEYSRTGKNKLGKAGATLLRPALRLYASSESGFTIAVNMARFLYANKVIELYNANSKAQIKILKEAGIGDTIMEQTGRLNGLNDKTWVDRISFLMMAMRWTGSRISTALNVWRTGATFADIITRGRSTKLENKYFNKANVDKGRSALGLVVFMPIMASIFSTLFRKDDDKDFWEKFEESFTKDFGKFVFGKTRFDLTAGVAPVVTAVAKTMNLMWNPKHGKDTWDPIARFFKNRQAPIMSIMYGILEHGRTLLDDTHMPTDIMGQPEKFSDFVAGTLLPIYVDNIIRSFGADKDPEVGTLEASAGVLADVFGISATTYTDGKSKAEILQEWGKASPLAKINLSTNLATKLSPEEFRKAQEEMANIYLDEANKLINSSNFENMDRAQKDKALSNLHRNVTDRLSRKYGVAAKHKKSPKKNRLK